MKWKRSFSGEASTDKLITLLVTLAPASPKNSKEILEDEPRFKDAPCNSGSAADKTDRNTVSQVCLQSHTYHIIQETKTIVASLNELKKRIRSSPSWPSFFSATPKSRANSTSPRIFIPSISVPTGICRGKTKTKQNQKGLVDARPA